MTHATNHCVWPFTTLTGHATNTRTLYNLRQVSLNKGRRLTKPGNTDLSTHLHKERPPVTNLNSVQVFLSQDYHNVGWVKAVGDQGLAICQCIALLEFREELAMPCLDFTAGVGHGNVCTIVLGIFPLEELTQYFIKDGIVLAILSWSVTATSSFSLASSRFELVTCGCSVNPELPFETTLASLARA